VQDDGMGIPAELLPRLFDLFVQGDRSLARSEGGLGIGLTVVKSLAEMHCGSVEARSAGPGRGSELVVRLPLLHGAGRPQANGTTRAHGPPAASRRVLVVDDNPDAEDSLALLMQMHGHEVRTARDGPAALRMAEELRPEVVLLDIGLPGMDGYEVARKLRGQAGIEDALLVAVTGYGQEEDRQRAHQAGFDLHLVKPVDPDALIEAVATRRSDRPAKPLPGG
jgi:CheY-like chemotaxis protein